MASRAATVTMVGAAGGGIFAMFYSYVIRRKKFKGKLDIPLLSAGILAGLVGITAICAVTSPWEGFIIGILGGAAGIGGRCSIYFSILNGLFIQSLFKNPIISSIIGSISKII